MAATYNILDVKQSIICDQCGGTLEKDSSALRKDFGEVKIRMDMQFCGRACQDRMISSMLTSPVTPHNTKHELMIESPLLTKQLKIECGLESCPHHKKGKKASEESEPSSAPEPTPESIAEGDASIEENFMTKLKRTFGTKDFYVDTESIAQDIVKRVMWFSQKPGGIKNHTTEISKSGEDIRDEIYFVVRDMGYQNKIKTNSVFEEQYFLALSDEEVSQSFFPQSAEVTKPIKSLTSNDKSLAKELAVLLRRSLDSARKPESNKAQIALDIRKVVRSVIDKTGLPGFQFLVVFLFDVTTKGINA